MNIDIKISIDELVAIRTSLVNYKQILEEKAANQKILQEFFDGRAETATVALKALDAAIAR